MAIAWYASQGRFVRPNEGQRMQELVANMNKDGVQQHGIDGQPMLCLCLSGC